MAAKTLNYTLPFFILGFLWRLYSLQETSLFLLFSVCVAILAFFSVLIKTVLKNKKAAPELMARTMTFWWMVTLFLIGVTTNQKVSIALVALFSGLAFWEYLSFRKGNGSLEINRFSLTLCFALVPLNFFLQYKEQTEKSLLLLTLFLVLLLPSLLVLENKVDGVLRKYGYLASGILFFVFSFGLAAALVKQDILFLLLCFFLTEMRDMVSYWLGKFTAKQFQKKPNSSALRLMNLKIAEKVSPNKSWGVGVLSSLLIALLSLACHSLVPSLSREFMLLWGFVIGVFGLMGDLVFSMFKREFGLKDSGSLLPGETGVIDRIDSLVLTIPVTYLLFIYFH